MKSPPWNILVFPAGTEVGLEIHRSLASCKEVRLFGASAPVPNHGPCVFAQYREVPAIDSPAALPALLALVAEWQIDCIFPANPLVMDFLDSHRDALPCDAVLPDSEAYRLVRSKSACYRALAAHLPVPTLFQHDDVPGYPLYLKPDRMYGSQGGQRIDSAIALAAAHPSADQLLCEYLPGPEFTVDCFSDRHGKLRFAGPRTRERIRMGTSLRSESPDADTAAELVAYAETVQRVIGLRGPWFLQMKRAHNQQLKLLEVDPRIAGTMAFHRVQGVNFALLALFDRMGQDLDIRPLPHTGLRIDRALTNRYQFAAEFSTVYVDWDDTLLIKGALNTELIAFLFQCINRGKRIELVSKSLAPDKDALLARWRLQGLFDAVHWLPLEARKSDFTRDPHGIFIDDSFSQRQEVHERCGIPCFAPDAVEALLDDRRT